MSKISIRFFNDREVRAVWDEANSKWWFSVLDVHKVVVFHCLYGKYKSLFAACVLVTTEDKNEFVC